MSIVMGKNEGNERRTTNMLSRASDRLRGFEADSTTLQTLEALQHGKNGT